VIEYLHRDRRHATEHRETLGLNQRERLAGVEVVHHDEFAAEAVAVIIVARQPVA